MITTDLKRCPVGIQTFEKIRKGDYLYVDKTDLVHRMTYMYKYVFLSRPRRFGKSLLTSTLHSYFEGRKDLFHGLAIEGLETEWTQHPVLHFDMSTAKHVGVEELKTELAGKLTDYEKLYGPSEPSKPNLNQRLQGLIERAYAQTGRQVVVLIDEYDAPLLDVVHEDENLPALRHVMRNFYSPLKACDPYLRFVFLTGITKFSQMSIFSELNNLSNISMNPEYAALCGITQEELETCMADYVERMGTALGIGREETLLRLKAKYDGYHFCWPSPDVYNPFSLLNAFTNNRLDDYWFGSGTPTYLIEMMRKFSVRPSEIGSKEVMASDFDAPTERMTDIVPLLYQSGYLTIKACDTDSELYLLDIPNTEIRVGLMKSLLPSYLAPNVPSTLVNKAGGALRRGDMDGALRLIQEFLLTVPYCDNTDYEGHYQQLLYIIFSLLGQYVDVEVRTPRGRVDLVMRTRDTLYLIELKLDKGADTALAQINLKDYAARFATCGLPVVKVGIDFDSERRTIGEWKMA